VSAVILAFDRPVNPGNGVLEALAEIETRPKLPDVSWPDWILAELWDRGFKVVPLEAGD
jgi:hypothetical protein